MGYLVSTIFYKATITFEFVGGRYAFVDGFTPPVTLRRKSTSVLPIPRDGRVEVELWLRKEASDISSEKEAEDEKVFVLCKVEAKVRTLSLISLIQTKPAYDIRKEFLAAKLRSRSRS